MKFSITKVTSDDECSEYIMRIEFPVRVGKDKGKIEHFSFVCNDLDIQMMQETLTLRVKPHPQRIVKGCPCLGYKTCIDCAANYQEKLKLIEQLRTRTQEQA